MLVTREEFLEAVSQAKAELPVRVQKNVDRLILEVVDNSDYTLELRSAKESYNLDKLYGICMGYRLVFCLEDMTKPANEAVNRTEWLKALFYHEAAHSFGAEHSDEDMARSGLEALTNRAWHRKARILNRQSCSQGSENVAVYKKAEEQVAFTQVTDTEYVCPVCHTAGGVTSELSVTDENGNKSVNGSVSACSNCNPDHWMFFTHGKNAEKVRILLSKYVV